MQEALAAVMESSETDTGWQQYMQATCRFDACKLGNYVVKYAKH